LFALSRPKLVVTAITIGLITNVVVGYLLSRLVSYDLAIVGFDAGAITLAFVSTWFFRRMLPNFDYYFFAATT
jgi:O-antigen/teichoic acid export membrane protein